MIPLFFNATITYFLAQYYMMNYKNLSKKIQELSVSKTKLSFTNKAVCWQCQPQLHLVYQQREYSIIVKSVFLTLMLASLNTIKEKDWFHNFTSQYTFVIFWGGLCFLKIDWCQTLYLLIINLTESSIACNNYC